ncbi:MAG: four helix bundle protein [Kiritimatiellae bacterium]|nr:four helix bundle protein [Kiritimatiellia bacterium]
MPTYKRFEDLPAWDAATDLAVAVFKLTEAQSFRYKGDLVNQLRRAALSVANNIAEGFERGTTNELITFLYIARGSAGEVRSMLRFAVRLGEMPDQTARIDALVSQSESVSRQIRAWLDSLQNSDIHGQRHLNEKSRRIYDEDRRAKLFSTRLAAYREEMERQLSEGIYGKPDAPPLPPFLDSECESAGEPAKAADGGNSGNQKSGSGKSGSDAPAPLCPKCGRTMVRRTSRDGAPFWGCSAYPQCKGSRPARK